MKERVAVLGLHQVAKYACGCSLGWFTTRPLLLKRIIVLNIARTHSQVLERLYNGARQLFHVVFRPRRYPRKESAFDCNYMNICGVSNKMPTKANISPIKAPVFIYLPAPKLCSPWCDSLKAIKDKPAMQVCTNITPYLVKTVIASDWKSIAFWLRLKSQTGINSTVGTEFAFVNLFSKSTPNMASLKLLGELTDKF